MYTETMKLKFESFSHNEQFARVVTAVFLSRINPTVEELEDVKTAVSEAVTNAVIHGYETAEGWIGLEAQITEEETEYLLTLKIRDEGVGIADVAQAMEPLYTSKPSRDRSGMGFSFMEAFMDSLLVDSAPGAGTTVTMTKRFEKERGNYVSK